jgi:hypothetical protein
MSTGLGLSAMQAWLPEWAARVLGNTLLATAPMLAWQGARLFRGASSKLHWVIAVAVVTLLSDVALVYVWPSARTLRPADAQMYEHKVRTRSDGRGVSR